MMIFFIIAAAIIVILMCREAILHRGIFLKRGLWAAQVRESDSITGLGSGYSATDKMVN